MSGGEEPRSRRYVSYVKGHYKKISKKDNSAKESTDQSAHTRVFMNQTQQDSNETTLSQVWTLMQYFLPFAPIKVYDQLA